MDGLICRQRIAVRVYRINKSTQGLVETEETRLEHPRRDWLNKNTFQKKAREWFIKNRKFLYNSIGGNQKII